MNYAPFSILNELNTNKLNIDMLDAKFQAELEIRPLKGLEVKALGAVRYVKTTREHRINDKSNAAEAYRADMDALKVKEETGMPSRCMPFEQEHIADTCPVCGKPANKMVVWGIAY